MKKTVELVADSVVTVASKEGRVPTRPNLKSAVSGWRDDEPSHVGADPDPPDLKCWREDGGSPTRPI